MLFVPVTEVWPKWWALMGDTMHALDDPKHMWWALMGDAIHDPKHGYVQVGSSASVRVGVVGGLVVLNNLTA
jgi:hypothetical protein